MYMSMKNLREQPNTARVGIKWTEEEDNDVMKEALDGMNLHDIAKKHERTIGGIKIRIMNNLLTIMKDRNLSIQDLQKPVYISVEDLENHKQRQEKKKPVTKIQETSNNDNVPYKEFMIVLTEIRDYLKIIADK
jgi:hypothetical protein